mgnify:CR=1 FL=1
MQQVLVGAVLVGDVGVESEGGFEEGGFEVAEGGDFGLGEGLGGVDGLLAGPAAADDA